MKDHQSNSESESEEENQGHYNRGGDNIKLQPEGPHNKKGGKSGTTTKDELVKKALAMID
jgi:hypothetical protein